MRIIIAECTVDYLGRGQTHLPKAVRMVMVKRDGSVSIHSDDRAYKPINWMQPPCLTQVDRFIPKSKNYPFEIWTVSNGKESLIINFYDIVSETEHELSEVEPGLNRSWTEKHLQGWIAGHMELVFGEGWSLIQREFQTGAGPVDILAWNPEGIPVAVEVKRNAMLGSVDQAYRYVQALSLTSEYPNALGLVVALSIKPKTLILAKQRGILTLEIPMSLYRGANRIE